MKNTFRCLLMAFALSTGCSSGGGTRPGDGGVTTKDAQGATGGRTGSGGLSGGGSTGNTGGTGVPGSGGSSVGGSVPPGTGGTTGGGGTAGAGVMGCFAGGPQCNNCIDDDMDGRIDAADPECVGATDNDESTFDTGIPGDNSDACKQDCFFDGDSGMGNDGCEWNLKCDPQSPGSHSAKPCPYDSGFNNCPTTQSARCLSTCRAATPNGCDCFGCCVVPGAPTAIKLVPTCTAAGYNDPTKCPACTQVSSCVNTCGRCEICVGKPTLPADCLPSGTGGMGGGTGAGGSGASGTGGSGGSGAPGTGGAGGGVETPCPGTVMYCGPGGIPPQNCPAGTYCTTGCCVPIIF